MIKIVFYLTILPHLSTAAAKVFAKAKKHEHVCNVSPILLYVEDVFKADLLQKDSSIACKKPKTKATLVMKYKWNFSRFARIGKCSYFILDVYA